ncbi:MAG: VWA domain-containing protein [Planctomycetota bacterium]
MIPTLAVQAKSAASVELRLWGDYALADPWYLLVLPVGLLLLAYGRARAGRAEGRAPVLPAGRLARSWRQRLGFLPTLLQALAMALAVLALARPLRGNVQNETISEGVDIALVLDRSGSMRFDDLERGRTRLDVVKDVVADFAQRRMGDAEGAADSCALITFARYPQLLCPFTLDFDGLNGFLEGVELVQHRGEDGTGIGVAVAKAVALLRETEAKSKVVVLLTDGENNVTEILPRQAGELAAEEGVRVYSIYAARNLFVYNALRGYVPTTDSHDTSDLEAIAELTGGRFYRARNRESLAEIYAEIEKLERTEREERRFEENFDLYPSFLWAAFALYGAAWLSLSTWARRLP